jgi:regulator of protease activity HflC (stomatin/prohibitin superfamily)
LAGDRPEQTPTLLSPAERRQSGIPNEPWRRRFKSTRRQISKTERMSLISTYLLPLFVVLAVVVLSAAMKILRQYERAVVFTLGTFQAVKGPGLVPLIPFLQEMARVDQRIQVVEIPSQDVISRHNVSIKVDAVLYFNVSDPERAILKVQDYLPATHMLAQTTLRAVLGQHELDEMLSERKKLSADVQAILDAQTEAWASRSAMWRSAP